MLGKRKLVLDCGVPGGRGCVTRGAFDLYLGELIRDGYVAKDPENILIIPKGLIIP